MTDLAGFEVLSEGSLRFLALSWAEAGRTAPVAEALAIPVLKRQEGVLLCIPCGFLSLAVLDEGAAAEADALVGLSTQITLPLGTSDEQGVEQPLDLEAPVLLVDFGLGVLGLLRDLGEDLVAEGIFPYHLHQPEATPLSDDLLVAARTWVADVQGDRVAFYSAVEEAAQEVEPVPPRPKGKKAPPKKRVSTADLAQQLGQLASVLPQLSEQLSSMKQRQEDLEKQVQTGVQAAPAPPAKPPHQQPFLPSRGPGLPMAKHAALTGPPPRTRPHVADPLQPDVSGGVGPLDAAVQPASPQDSFQTAMLQQSQALSNLVSHLMSQQDGGLEGLASSASSTCVGSKGAAKRERLQAALAARSGDFYLSVLQAASKRLRPTSPVPTSLEECLGQVSMCQYLERFGGYAGYREIGYTMWCLAHVMDCLTDEDYAGAREFLALTFVALDQSSLDHGRWDFAWLLTLLEEPPAQLFHGRGVVANPRSRAFSPLSPAGWTTCALQFLKEIDLITTRRLESLGHAKASPQVPASSSGADAGQEGQRPKRPPKNPRKPRADGAK